MAVSPEFRTYVLEQFGRVTPVTGRSMFGGVGIYADGTIFALIAGDVVYLKVDDSNRPDFEAIGMRPFRPYGGAGGAMGYFELPGELLESPDDLRPWIEKAMNVARTARRRRR